MVNMDFVPQNIQEGIQDIIGNHVVNFSDAFIKLGYKSESVQVDGKLTSPELDCLKEVLGYMRGQKT